MWSLGFNFHRAEGGKDVPMCYLCLILQDYDPSATSCLIARHATFEQILVAPLLAITLVAYCRCKEERGCTGAEMHIFGSEVPNAHV